MLPKTLSATEPLFPGSPHLSPVHMGALFLLGLGQASGSGAGPWAHVVACGAAEAATQQLSRAAAVARAAGPRGGMRSSGGYRVAAEQGSAQTGSGLRWAGIKGAAGSRVCLC
jgi:hypothetical protein